MRSDSPGIPSQTTNQTKRRENPQQQQQDNNKPPERCTFLLHQPINKWR